VLYSFRLTRIGSEGLSIRRMSGMNGRSMGRRARMQFWLRLKGGAGGAGAHLRILLAIASFVIYVSAVVGLHPDRNNFLAEREAFAAAVSSAVYGAPLGTAYLGVATVIHYSDTPLATALEQTAARNVTPGTLLQDGGMEGNGIGYIVLATWSMLIFGPHVFSPILLMLGLMGLSGAAFLWRFGDDQAVVVLLYFFALTLLLFTPVVWAPDVALGLPIGGIHYFAVVGTLPAFHLAAEVVDSSALKLAIGRWRFFRLAVQVVILVLAVLTRTSNASLLGAIGLIWLFILWRNRRDRSRVWRHIGNGAFIAGMAGGFFALIILLLPPNYLGDGRVRGIVWHRVFVGLGLNTAWPFGNLREIYDCNYDPSLPGLALEPGLLDNNGACVWIHYAHTHNLSPREQSGAIDSVALYEAVLRDAFINVVRLYPREVLETYIYYKSPMAYAELKSAVEPYFNLNGYSALLKGLFVAAFVNLLYFLLAFLVTPSAAPDPARSLRFGGMTLLFALFSFPGYFAAWPGTTQTFDLKLYAILAAGAALNTLVAWVKLEWVKRTRSAGGLEPVG